MVGRKLGLGETVGRLSLFTEIPATLPHIAGVPYLGLSDANTTTCCCKCLLSGHREGGGERQNCQMLVESLCPKQSWLKPASDRYMDDSALCGYGWHPAAAINSIESLVVLHKVN